MMSLWIGRYPERPYILRLVRRPLILISPAHNLMLHIVCLIGFLTLYLYTSHGSPRPVVVCLSLALAVIVPADILRLNFPWFERIYERWLGFLMRETEKVYTVPLYRLTPYLPSYSLRYRKVQMG